MVVVGVETNLILLYAAAMNTSFRGRSWMQQKYTSQSLSSWLDDKGYLCPQLLAWRDLRTKLSAASNSHISFENIVAVDGKSASSDIEEEQCLSAQELRELILSDFDVAAQVVPSHQVWEIFTLIEDSSWLLVKSLDGDDWSCRPRDLDVWSEKCERCGHWVTEDLLTTSVDCSEFPLCEDCFKLLQIPLSAVGLCGKLVHNQWELLERQLFL